MISKANYASKIVHRLNLFPLTHLNFFHMIFNLFALTPLLERFESEFGTLVTLALFTGRKRYDSEFGRALLTGDSVWYNTRGCIHLVREVCFAK